MTEEPTHVEYDDQKVRLKWHKLRRRAQDPPFARGNLRAGLAAGASMEVDIRSLACGRFVCLHDPRLESETTGQGPVADAEAEDLTQLRMRGSDERLLLLDELVEIVRSSAGHPAALVQLDLYGDVDAAAAEVFAATLDGVAQSFILSGHGWDNVSRLGAGVPGLALGYDPSDQADSSAEVLRAVEATAAQADTIYLHRKIVRAAREQGDGLVGRLQERGHRIDCWTIDHGSPAAVRDFLAAVMAGCDQITTNTPLAWAQAKL
jgi:glycerophosphoryl diester phosphodiesterase